MTLLEQTLRAIGPLDRTAMAAARSRQQALTKPAGSLGVLERLHVQLAGIAGTASPALERPWIVVMAGDHGVTAEGVSPYPGRVTGEMVGNFAAGGAAINVLARDAGAHLVVVDLGVAWRDRRPAVDVVRRSVGDGTANLAVAAAMSRAQAHDAIEVGIETVADAVADGADLIALGEMGIGNTTASAALIAALTGQPARAVTGLGSGLDREGWERKVAVVERALARHRPDPSDPLGALAAVGGFEIAGLVGAIVGAAAARRPVLLDGTIVGAAALVAAGLCPAVRPYLIASHRSPEPGHRLALEYLELEPLIELGLRLGEGSGAAIALHLVRLACRLPREMATFEEAGVSRRRGRLPGSAGVPPPPAPRGRHAPTTRLMTERPLAPVLMIQGTASHVGKSILTTALCRIFRQQGLRVAPFKAQNMALNAYVAVEGGEIGRAQAVQAEAAGIEASIDMNPILLKPEGEARAQVVVNGRSTGSLAAAEYYRTKSSLWPVVAEALARLRSRVDLIVAEGAGSPAEINLRHADLANMRVALHAQAPVVLVGDIERGGVFAALVGTLALLEPEERALVCGVAINKFRGDPAILESGLRLLERRTGVPVLGVIPFLRDLDLPEEDSLALDGLGPAAEDGALDVVVVRLPRIANFDDFAPLAAERRVALRYVDTAARLGRPDLVILPGTKTTMADLAWLWQTGLAGRITSIAARGTPVLGICGGLQMLGQRILDPARSESAETEAEGLGLLSLQTTFATTKRTCRVAGSVIADRGPFALAAGASVTGYEIHMGRTELLDGATPLFAISERSNAATDDRDGLVSPDGLVLGSYLHGLFDNDAIRQALVGWLLERRGESPTLAITAVDRDRQYDDLADAVRRSLDVPRLAAACGLGQSG